MSENTLKYNGTTYALSDKAAGFVNSLLAKGMAEDEAFAALQAAIEAGIVKASDKPKQHIPDWTEIAAPVVARAMKRNSGLKQAVAGYFDARDALDVMTAEAGIGDGFEWNGSYAYGISISREGDSDLGIKSVNVKLDPECDMAKAAQRVIDMHRSAEASLFAIGRKVAEKNGHNGKDALSQNVQLIDRNTVKLTIGGRKARKRSGGGGGPRSKYDVTVEDGNVTIKLDGTVLASGSTAEELAKGLKESLPELGKTYYASQWSRKEWWPQS